MPDDHRLAHDSILKYFKDNRTTGKSHVHGHSEMVKPSSSEAQISLSREQVKVAVDKTV